MTLDWCKWLRKRAKNWNSRNQNKHDQGFFPHEQSFRNQLVKVRRVHSLLLHMNIAHLLVTLVVMPKEILHNYMVAWFAGDFVSFEQGKRRHCCSGGMSLSEGTFGSDWDNFGKGQDSKQLRVTVVQFPCFCYHGVLFLFSMVSCRNESRVKNSDVCFLKPNASEHCFSDVPCLQVLRRLRHQSLNERAHLHHPRPFLLHLLPSLRDESS